MGTEVIDVVEKSRAVGTNLVPMGTQNCDFGVQTVLLRGRNMWLLATDSGTERW